MSIAKRLFLTFLLCVCASGRAAAQEAAPADSGDGFGVEAALMSHYVWRGIEYTDAPVGLAALSYAYGGFEVSATGIGAVNGSYSELDFQAVYSCGFLTVGLMDMFNPSAAGTPDRFTDFSRSTGHCLELFAELSPFDKVPVSLLLSSFVAGADRDMAGRQAYSSYAELNYTFPLKNNNSLALGVGCSLNNGLYNSYDGRGFGCALLSATYTTMLPLGSFQLPLAASVAYNPLMDKAFAVFTLMFSTK